MANQLNGELVSPPWPAVPRIKIACLQFAPKLGKVEENMQRASEILQRDLYKLRSDVPVSTTWLVLPEMAFSGYNFQSLDQILPYLEPTTSGQSTHWAIETAKQYGLYVTVGYPEHQPSPIPPKDSNEAIRTAAHYNSTVTVDPSGRIIANVRKHFLYYTDETWALEGQNTTLSTKGSTAEAFFSANLGDKLGPVSMGICMDINNYKFTAPWTAFEFANHCLDSSTPLVICSMAWLTHIPIPSLSDPSTAGEPDTETLIYWTERFAPLKAAAESLGREAMVVIANRCGTEGSAGYAGTSCVMRFSPTGGIEFLDLMGRGEEGVMVVGTGDKARFALQRVDEAEGYPTKQRLRRLRFPVFYQNPSRKHNGRVAFLHNLRPEDYEWRLVTFKEKLKESRVTLSPKTNTVTEWQAISLDSKSESNEDVVIYDDDDRIIYKLYSGANISYYISRRKVAPAAMDPRGRRRIWKWLDGMGPEPVSPNRSPSLPPEKKRRIPSLSSSEPSSSSSSELRSGCRVETRQRYKSVQASVAAAIDHVAKTLVQAVVDDDASEERLGDEVGQGDGSPL